MSAAPTDLPDDPHDDEAGEPQWRLHLLGGFRLECRGRRLMLSGAVQRLLAVLALHGPLPRRVIAGRLWPATPEARAQGNLRSALWRLGREADLLDVGPEGVALAPVVDVDVDVLVAAIRAATSGAPLVAPPGTSAAGRPALPHQELLPDWDDDWVVLERERLRQLQMHALEEYALWCASQRLYREALDAALRAVGLEPLRESAHRVVMRVHLDEGNLVEARRHFRRYRDMVRRELGVEPTPRMWELIDTSAGVPRSGVVEPRR